MAMPAMPGAGFIMVEAEFVLGCLEAFLDPPACSFHADQSVDRRAVRAPGGEIGAFTIGDTAPDQQTARPQARRGGVELFSVKIGQRAIGPVIEPLSLGAEARGQTLPCVCGQVLGDILCFTRNERRCVPGTKPVIGMHSQCGFRGKPAGIPI